MTAGTRRRPGVGSPGAAVIGHHTDTPHGTAPVGRRPGVPYDPAAERYVIAGAIAGPDLAPGDLEPGDMYVPAHGRIAAAVRLLAADHRPVRRTAWRTRYGRRVVVWELPGLDDALAAVGSPDVHGDLVAAERIMAGYPGRGAELVRVRDLAARRRRMAALAAEYAALAAEGVPA